MLQRTHCTALGCPSYEGSSVFHFTNAAFFQPTVYFQTNPSWRKQGAVPAQTAEY